MLSFYLPTKIIFGYDCWKNYQLTDLKKLGNKCLIVTGKNSAKLSGALYDTIAVLKYNNIDFVIFDNITENPEFSDIFEAVKILKKNNCEFVVGIGGGSPIDAAKATAIISANNFQDKEIYNAELIKNKIPIVAIPTTAGAGAEATPFSVLSDKNTKLKAGAGHPFLFPDLSFVDPKYTFTTSKIVTRDSGLDALSHLLEGIYSNRRNKIIFPLIAKGINLIYKNLKKVMKYPDHKIARENMMIAALYGGMTIAQTSTTLQHSIGYPLTSRLGITHGAANAIVMKFIMRLFYPAVKSEFDDIMKLANLKKNKFIEFIESFDIDISNKSNASIIADNIQDITKQIMNSRNMLNNPIKIIECDILEIYKKLKLI